MSELQDTYSPSKAVTEAAELSELDLAVLIVPRGDDLGEDQTAYTASVAKVKKMLNLSVAERLERQCARDDCHTIAIWLLEPTEGEPLMSCQKDLALLVDGPCSITPLDPPVEPEESS